MGIPEGVVPASRHVADAEPSSEPELEPGPEPEPAPEPEPEPELEPAAPAAPAAAASPRGGAGVPEPLFKKYLPQKKGRRTKASDTVPGGLGAAAAAAESAEPAAAVSAPAPAVDGAEPSDPAPAEPAEPAAAVSAPAVDGAEPSDPAPAVGGHGSSPWPCVTGRWSLRDPAGHPFHYNWVHGEGGAFIGRQVPSFGELEELACHVRGRLTAVPVPAGATCSFEPAAAMFQINWEVSDPPDAGKDIWTSTQHGCVFCQGIMLVQALPAGSDSQPALKLVDGVFGVLGEGSADLGTFIGERIATE